jgi:hypothetical protein
MKTLLLWLALASLTFANGERFPTLETRDGKSFSDVLVRSVEPDGITISHAAGIAHVRFELLPDDVRKVFNFDPAKAAEYRTAQKRAIIARSEEEAKIKGEQNAVTLEKKRLASLEWEYITLKVDHVLAGGLLCYRHTEGGPVGSAARGMSRIMGGGSSSVENSSTDWSTPLFVVGVNKTCAEGDILRGYAARDGSSAVGSRTLQRWISKPSP